MKEWSRAHVRGKHAARMALALVFVAGGCLASCLVLFGPALAQPLPPPVGDWVVDNDTTVVGQQLQLNGSLSVTNGSTLTLVNSTLELLSPSGEELWVNISAASAIQLSNCSVDVASPTTIVRGSVQGLLQLDDSNWSHIDARDSSIATGIVVSGGGSIVVARSVVGASPVPFGLKEGTIRISDSLLIAIGRATVLGDSALAGDSGVYLTYVTLTDVLSVFEAACSGCTGSLTIDLDEVDDQGSYGGYTALVSLNGSGNFGRLSLDFEGVTVAAANRSLANLAYAGVDVFVQRVANSTTGPYFSALGSLSVRSINGSADLTATNSSSPGTVGFYVFLYASAAPFNFSFDRLGVGRMVVAAVTLGPVKFHLANSTVGELTGLGVLLYTASAQATVDLSNCTFGAAVRQLADDYGFSINPSAGLPAAPVQFAVSDSTFKNIRTGLALGVPVRLTLTRSEFSNIEMAVLAYSNVNSPSLGNSSFALSNLTLREVRLLLNVSSSLTDILPIPVTIANVDTSGRGAALLNYTGWGAQRLLFANITANGSLLDDGIWIKYTGRANVTLSNVSLANFRTALYIERALASGPADRWDLDNVSIGSSWNATELISGAPMGGLVHFSNCWLSASLNVLSLTRTATNVTACVLEGTGSHVYNQDGVVILREVVHNSHAVNIDARTNPATRLESWNFLGLRVLWRTNDLPPVGWRLGLREHLGAEFLAGTLDPGGRVFNGTREILLYRFTANFSDFDARNTSGNLTMVGRPNVTLVLDLTGNLSDVLLYADDRNAPSIVVAGEREGTVYFNASSFTLEATFWDPETGVGAGNITILNRTVFDHRDLSGSTAFTWDVASALSTPGEGFYTLIVAAKDSAGNLLELYLLLDIDFSAPNPVPLHPTQGGAVSATDFTILLLSDPDTWWVRVGGTNLTLSNGSWSALAVFLEGNHSVPVEAMDFAGNYRRIALSFAVDLTPPQPRVVGLVDGMSTNATLLAFSVEKDAGDLVIADGVLFAGNSTVQGASFVIGAGTTTHVLQVIDRAGNAVSFTYRITLDTQAPSMSLGPGVTPGTLIFVNRSAVTFPAQTDSDALFVEAAGIHFVPDALGVAIVALNLPEGSHDLVIAAVDRAGNRKTIPITVVVDLTPPGLVSSDPADGGRVNRQTVVLQLNLSEPCDVLWARGTAPGTGGVVNLTLAIQAGVNRFSFTLTDRAGNRASAQLELVGDFEAPSLSISSPLNGSRTAQDHVRLAGVAEPGARVFVNGFEIAVAANGGFAIDMPLAEGPNTLVVIARDQVGNEAFQTIGVTRGDEFPVVALGVAVAAALAVVAALLILSRRRPKTPGEKGPRPPT